MTDQYSKDLVVFVSSPDFSDNPRGLYEHIKDNPLFKCAWIIRDRELVPILREHGIECAFDGSEEAYELINNARFIVSSSFDFATIKKPDQIYVSAWHGFGPKVVGFNDNAESNTSVYPELTIMTTKCDLITASSSMCRTVTSGLFACDPRKVKVTGFPRNDLMFTGDSRTMLESVIGKHEGSKYILYLPTMRKGLKDEGMQFEENIFNFSDYASQAIDALLEEHDAYIITKLHFADNDLFAKDQISKPERVIFLSTEDLTHNMLTLYHIADAFECLVTDYSSIYSDFILLDKSIIFSCPDLEMYAEDRGFIMDDPRVMMPGPIVQDQTHFLDELAHALTGQDEYRNERLSMRSFFQTYADADSGKRLLGCMLEAAENGVPDCHKDFSYLYTNLGAPLNYLPADVLSEVFFDRGQGFTADDKCVIPYKVFSEERQTVISIDVDESIVGVRFDPTMSRQYCIEGFEAILNGSVLDYQVHNGCRLGNKIFFNCDDPQIIINIPTAQKGELCIEFIASDVNHCAGDVIYDLVQQLDDTQMRLQESKDQVQVIYESTSWKLTEPLRKIGRLAKKD